MTEEAAYYVIDAFADELFSGNPAGVCLLNEWPSDLVMQRVAAENNLAETAFFAKNGGDYDLRWFTPKSEIDLCGHATLASAFVITRYVEGEFLCQSHFEAEVGRGGCPIEGIGLDSEYR